MPPPLLTRLTLSKLHQPIRSSITRLPKPPTLPPSRLLSTTPARPKEYLIRIPDFPNTTTQRKSAQQAHILAATPLIEAKKLSFFGVTLSEETSSPGVSAEASSKETITGSVMVMQADSEAEIRAYLKKDAYALAGVWNVREAEVRLFRSG